MLHLDLIRCFSSGGQARTIAKASLPFPSSGHSLLLPAQGSSQGRIWGSHSSLLFTSSSWEMHSPHWFFGSRVRSWTPACCTAPRERGPFLGERVLGETSRSWGARRTGLGSMCVVAPEPRNAACCCPGDEPSVGCEAS